MYSVIIDLLYNKCIIMHMKFEWDANKSDANKLKHGIDFKTAKNIWFDEDRIEIQAPYPVEERWIVIGETL